MKVKTKNDVYSVKFHKEQVGTRKKRTIMTHCVVSKVDDNKKGRDRYLDIGIGTAKQHPMDKYSKLTGKMFALNRAMETAKKEINDKEERTKIWTKFFNEFSETK